MVLSKCCLKTCSVIPLPKVFTDHKIFSKVEIESRLEILLETYSKYINIEALTMLDMAKKDIIPAVSKYVATLAGTVSSTKAVNAALGCKAETALISKLSSLNDKAYDEVVALEVAMDRTKEYADDQLKLATYYRDAILPAMETLRATVDEMEGYTAESAWPIPAYGDLIFRV